MTRTNRRRSRTSDENAETAILAHQAGRGRRVRACGLAGAAHCDHESGALAGARRVDGLPLAYHVVVTEEVAHRVEPSRVRPAPYCGCPRLDGDARRRLGITFAGCEPRE